MKTKMPFIWLIPLLFVTLYPVTALPQTMVRTANESGSKTGRGVIVGKDGAAYKIGSKSVEVFYQSTGLQSDYLLTKKGDRNLTVNGTTSMNGMVGIASSDPMKKGAGIEPLAEIPGKTGLLFQPGEPVPGAEIYIELEGDPEARKIPVSSANPLVKKMDAQVRKVNITFNLNEKSFSYYIKNGERWVSSGVYVFGMETVINNVKSYNEFVVLIREPLKSFSITHGGPYSQSISNVEDNGRLSTGGTTAETDIEVRLFLVSSFTDIKQEKY